MTPSDLILDLLRQDGESTTAAIAGDIGTFKKNKVPAYATCPSTEREIEAVFVANEGKHCERVPGGWRWRAERLPAQRSLFGSD